MTAKNIKKLLAGALMICLCTGTIGSTAFAASYIDGNEAMFYDNISQAFSYAKSSVTMTSDETVSEQIVVGANKNITLDLNGCDIEKGAADKAVFRVDGINAELTIKDTSDTKTGSITGTDGSTAVITVVNGGKLNLEGGTIQNNTSSAEGGGIYANNGTVNVYGGTISGNEATEGGGIFAEKNSSVNISGGSITENRATQGGFTDNVSDRPYGGGGIALVGTGTLTMSGGEISSNVAEGAGGGIGIRHNYYNDNPVFEMTGGSIINNIAMTHEGGGIRIEGTGTIDPTESKSTIVISGNDCRSESDLGGGGIFVVNSSTVTIKNAVITDNSAGGLGGGVAGCIHGEISAFSPDGAATYGNTAQGEHYTKGAADKTGDPSYGTLPESLTENPDKAQDFFCAGYSIVDDYMLGGGSENWSGVVDGVDTTIGVGSAAYSLESIGLTASPSDDDIAKLDNLEGKVLITGNKAYMHGGGIATNGILNFGAKSSIYNYNIVGAKFSATKNLIKVNTATGEEEKISLDGKSFVFELLDDDKKVIGTASCDPDDGSINFDIPADKFNGAGTYTFYIREKAGTDPSVTYDNTEYTVQVEIEQDRDANTITVGLNSQIQVTTYFYAVKNIAITGADETPVFTNKIYYTPEDTEFDDDSPKGDEEPKDDDNGTDISNENIYLNTVVPKSGDMGSVWMALIALSGAGLFIARDRKRD
ncbi:MAG: FctA domain-containing protein [Clostridia bacterium]|nr:FctA domain-containing protein [Clostridia bacterium]